MKIESKFDVGQDVYLIKDNIIQIATVHRLKVNFAYGDEIRTFPGCAVQELANFDPEPLFQYYLKFGEDRVDNKAYYERYLFATKKELLNHLEKTI